MELIRLWSSGFVALDVLLSKLRRADDGWKFTEIKARGYLRSSPSL